MADASTIWKFVKPNLLRVYDMALLGLFHDFNKLRASCGRPQCVLPPFAETCTSSSSIHITKSPPSSFSKPSPSSRLPVLFFVSCVATGWGRWWARPPNVVASGRPPPAPSPPSPTSSPSFSERLIDCIHFLVHACMLQLLLLPAC